MSRARRQQAPSAIKSFVDVACSSYGGVMLLAIVLLRVSPSADVPGTVSGRLELRLPFGWAPRGFLTQWSAVILSVDGREARSCGDVSNHTSGVMPVGDGGQLRWEILAEGPGALADGRAALDLILEVSHLSEPSEAVWEIRLGGCDAPAGWNDGDRFFAGSMFVNLVGSAFTPRVADAFALDPEISLADAATSRRLELRARFDPEETRYDRVLKVVVHDATLPAPN